MEIESGILSPGRTIFYAVTASISITGLAWTLIINSINHLSASTEKQSDSLIELTKEVYRQRADEYKRREATSAHDVLNQRISLLETHNSKIETEIVRHIIDDNERFMRQHERLRDKE